MGFIKYLRRHRKNDDRPYTIGGVGGVLLALIVGVFALSVLDHYALQSPNLAAVISSVLVDLANSDRAANNISGLAVSPLLTEAAQLKANDMAAGGYFAHTSPDGKTPWYWFQQVGYQFSYAGENLAVNFNDSNAVNTAWLNSPEHRANIMSANFTEIGIATAEGMYEGQPTTFVVQEFGTPAEVEAPVENVTVPTNPRQPAIATTKPATKPQTKASPPAQAPVASNPTPIQPTTVLGASAQVAPTPTASASWWEHLVASPRFMLEYAYYVLGLVLLIILAIVTEFEWRQHHLRHVVAALGLIVLMGSLFTLADRLIFSSPVVADGATPASIQS